MAIRTKDELLTDIKEIIGERDDDTVLAFIENLTDTIDDYDVRVSDTTDWKNMYETNDKEWREKYKERFFKGESESVLDEYDTVEETDVDETKIKTFEELFD